MTQRCYSKMVAEQAQTFNCMLYEGIDTLTFALH